METFVKLFESLNQTTSTSTKTEALERFFCEADPRDQVWTIALFTGRRPRRLISSGQLRQWAVQQSGFSDWMVEECYAHVGDLAETLSLLLPSPHVSSEQPALYELLLRLLDLQKTDEAGKEAFVTHYWQALSPTARFLFNKLLTGGFRVGVSEKLIVKALAKVYQREESAITYALSGKWDPQNTSLSKLLASNKSEDASKPYPFYLAYALENEPESLGDVKDWQAEWKWDGIRAQLIKRAGEVYLWSRGEELLNDSFPDLVEAAQGLPDGTVLDGELVIMDDSGLRSFGDLQQRLGRKKPGKKLQQQLPAGLLCYDLLEWGNQDFRSLPLQARRSQLEACCAEWKTKQLVLSEVIAAQNWSELAEARSDSRNRQAEGLMLKRLDSPYESGRKKGDWWKWKVDPLSVDAVLLYAQQGHGRRAGLYTDYTFAVWDGDKLVTFAKAYSGLTDAEIKEVDKFIKAHTLEKFGPVRTVKPELVFEIGFEGIQASNRHKSGVALRFPRILRWRKDKSVDEANDINELRQLLNRF
jgi:DNA ligase-1